MMVVVRRIVHHDPAFIEECYFRITDCIYKELLIL